jgi:hypothetical protein
MTEVTKYIQIDDWIFEIKSVRALRVKEYGQPYSAIANVNINGDKAYIDGLMTKKEEEFTKKDFMAFYQYCQKLGVTEANFDRFKNSDLTSKSVDIQPKEQLTTTYNEKPILRLVR